MMSWEGVHVDNAVELVMFPNSPRRYGDLLMFYTGGGEDVLEGVVREDVGKVIVQLFT